MSAGLDRIERIIAEIAKGRMAILVKDVERENESDLIIAAEKVGAVAINFMAKHGRGLIRPPTTSEWLQQLAANQDKSLA